MSLAFRDGSQDPRDHLRWGEPKPRPRLWSINVMVVEDDAADTSLILSVLNRHPNVSATHAVDTPDLALKQLAAGILRPNLVLLDIHMPRMDGFEFLNSMRRMKSMAAVPVVILTSSALAKDVFGAKSTSVLTYVVKPDTLGELQTRLDAVIQRVLAGT